MEDPILARGPRTYRGLSHLRDSSSGTTTAHGVRSSSRVFQSREQQQTALNWGRPNEAPKEPVSPPTPEKDRTARQASAEIDAPRRIGHRSDIVHGGLTGMENQGGRARHRPGSEGSRRWKRRRSIPTDTVHD